jgi:hypothetical protein
MNYNLIIQPETEYNIQDVFEWYESQNSGLGSEFVRAKALPNIGSSIRFNNR